MLYMMIDDDLTVLLMFKNEFPLMNTNRMTRTYSDPAPIYCVSSQ